MDAKKSFRHHIQRTATGDADDVLYYPETGEVDQGTRHHVTLLSWEDTDSNFTKARVQVKRGRHTFRIKDDTNSTKSVTYNYAEEIVLTEGERVALYINGASASDVLHLWVQGFWVKLKESE